MFKKFVLFVIIFITINMLWAIGCSDNKVKGLVTPEKESEIKKIDTAELFTINSGDCYFCNAIKDTKSVPAFKEEKEYTRLENFINEDKCLRIRFMDYSKLPGRVSDFQIDTEILSVLTLSNTLIHVLVEGPGITKGYEKLILWRYGKDIVEPDIYNAQQYAEIYGVMLHNMKYLVDQANIGRRANYDNNTCAQLSTRVPNYKTMYLAINKLLKDLKEDTSLSEKILNEIYINYRNNPPMD